MKPPRDLQGSQETEARDSSANKPIKSRLGGSAKVVGATLNTMSILRYLSRADRPIRVSYIARETGIVPSTVFNILRTLSSEGYVRFHPDSKSYSMGAAILGLTSGVASAESFLAAAKPRMEEIARAYNVTVTIWQRIAREKMILRAAAESRSSLRILMNVGHQLPILVGGMGRVMARQSGMPENEIREIFEKMRKHTDISFEEYLLQADQALEKGWGVDDGITTAGVSAVSAPVLMPNLPVTWVSSATMFHGQHTPDTIEEIGQAVVQLSTMIANILPLDEARPSDFF